MVRQKNRYLLINILYPSRDVAQSIGKPDIVQFHQPSSPKLEPHILTRAIRDQVSMHFGDYGAGMIAASLSVKYLSPATSTAIIRVTRAHWRLVWAALTFMRKLPKPVDEACVIQVVRVSGTIRKAEEEAIRRARDAVLKARRQDQELRNPVPQTVVTAASHAEQLSFGGEGVEDEEMGEVVERSSDGGSSDEADEDG